MRYFVALWMSYFISPFCFAQPGSLDLSFGQQGSYLFRPNFQTVSGESIIDSEGKIVLSGWMQAAESSVRLPLLARLNPDGMYDPAFGNLGYLDVEGLSQFADYPYYGTVAQQSNGSYLSLAYNNFDGHMLYRINTDGVIDNTFLAVPFTLHRALFYRSAIDSQDRLVVSCFYFPDDNIYQYYANTAVMRFTAAGELDASFGTNGMVLLGNLENDERCYDVAVDASDNIYVTGYWAQSPGNGNSTARIYALNESGQLRTDFGANGILEIQEPGIYNSFSGLCLSASGDEIIIAGTRYNPQTFIQQGMLVKISSTGSPIFSFGTNGVHYSSDTDAEYKYVTRLNDGNYAVAARVNNADFGRDVRVSIVNPSGGVVESFGVAGNTDLFDIAFGDDNPLDIFQDEQGRILIAGYGFALDDIPSLGVQWGEKGFIACYQYSPVTGLDNHTQLVGDVFPNPASDQVFISGGEGMTYRLTDAAGKLLRAGRMQTGTLSVSDLSPGLYLLTIGSEVHKLKVE